MANVKKLAKKQKMVSKDQAQRLAEMLKGKKGKMMAPLKKAKVNLTKITPPGYDDEEEL